MSTDQRPLIQVIGTGGSISFIGSDRMDYTEYSYSGNQLTVFQLLERVPEVQEFARTRAEQLINVGSPSITPAHWLGLAKRINQLFREDPEVAGVGITHGTSTLEETAYFLNLVVKSNKPVVITGAMRPPSGLASDVDPNLIDCVRVAASPQARGKGVLTILNKEIQAAREVTKSHTQSLETFRSNDVGLLGYADSDHQVVFYRAPIRPHTLETEFDVEGIEELPRVDIVHSYAGADGLLVRSVVEAGVPGIVAAGLGSGGSPPAFTNALVEARQRGAVVVISSQVGSGRVVRVRRFQERGFVVADNLAPKKARILLMLALTVTDDVERIQEMFYRY